jgi:sec-independent protein translocase protein TatC
MPIGTDKNSRGKNIRGEMPFLDHLEELRWRILWSLLAVVVGAGVGIFLVIRFDVIHILTGPLFTIMTEIQAANPDFMGGNPVGKLSYLDLTEVFFFKLKLGIITGLLLVFPILAYQLWAFLSPALEKREKRVIVPSLYFGLLLFAAGVAMAYSVALPVTIRFLLLFGAEDFVPVLTAGLYLSFVTRLLLAFGILFELPVVVMILSVLGLVTPALLRKYRRHSIVANTILASFLSPGDIITVTLLMMIPLILLYEVGIILSVMIYKRKEEPQIDPDPPEGSVSVE